MRKHETVRFYIACPRCGAKPGERCVTQDQWHFTRSNHPARNQKYAEVHAAVASREQRATCDRCGGEVVRPERHGEGFCIDTPEEGR